MPIILLLSDVSEYIQGIITAAIALTAIWGFRKVLKEIKKENDAEHDRRQRWDGAADIIEKKAESWDKGLADIEEMRVQMMKRYDDRLDNQDARTQQLYSMQCMSLRAQDAILEALVAQGIGNGDIKSMHKELREFIIEQVQ